MRRKIIHPRFQGTIILFGLLIGLFCLGLNFLANMYFFERSKEALIGSGMTAEHPVFFFLNEQKIVMMGFFFVAFALAIIIATTLGFILSERVARPLNLMKNHFEGAAKGQAPTRLHFRKTDYFQEVADAYNYQLEALGLVPRQSHHDPDPSIKTQEKC